VRPVKVNQQDDTGAVISDGLKAEERVVTTGFTRLSNGTRVRVQPGEGEAAAASDTPPAPDAAPSERRRKRDGAEGTGGKERRRSETTTSPPSVKQ
jgi:multidrug efflux system membrane fusion protein